MAEYNFDACMRLWKLCDKKKAPTKKQIEILLKKGADINTDDGEGGYFNDEYTLLLWAAYNGRTETVKVLAEMGANVHAVGKLGDNACICAAQNGHTETLMLVASLGADIDAKDKYGKTACMMAAGHGHIETLKCLAALGADIYATDERGETALDYISDEKTKQEIIKISEEFDKKNPLVKALREKLKAADQRINEIKTTKTEYKFSEEQQRIHALNLSVGNGR